jgi:putative polyhydroxyalkanoic acid system protein
MSREASEHTGSCGVVQGMPQPLVISIPHSLGKEEATRRLKAGLATAQSQFRQVFTVQEEIWSGDRLQFRIAALAQTASGTIDVADDHVRLEIELPWLLAKAAQQIQRVVNARGALMLEKK